MEVLLPQRLRERLGPDVQMDTKCFDAKLSDGRVIEGVLVIGGAAMFGTIADPATPPAIDPEDIVAIRNWGQAVPVRFFRRWVTVVQRGA